MFLFHHSSISRDSGGQIYNLAAEEAKQNGIIEDYHFAELPQHDGLRNQIAHLHILTTFAKIDSIAHFPMTYG